MRKSRNGLRPITVTGKYRNYKAYFHCIVHEGNLEDGISPYAIVENEDGQIGQEYINDIKFDDMEEQE